MRGSWKNLLCKEASLFEGFAKERESQPMSLSAFFIRGGLYAPSDLPLGTFHSLLISSKKNFEKVIGRFVIDVVTAASIFSDGAWR